MYVQKQEKIRIPTQEISHSLFNIKKYLADSSFSIEVADELIKNFNQISDKCDEYEAEIELLKQKIFNIQSEVLDLFISEGAKMYDSEITKKNLSVIKYLSYNPVSFGIRLGNTEIFKVAINEKLISNLKFDDLRQGIENRLSCIPEQQ